MDFSGPVGRTAPTLEVVIPVHNEEVDLERSVRRLHAHLSSQVPYTFRITVADNASTDSTVAVAEALAQELPHVAIVRLAEKGKGRAVREVWLASDAAVLAYMDVDLSTDLAALLPLIAPLISGHSDLAVGTRLHRSSRVARGIKRELISRCYNVLLRRTLDAKFSDAQCGFKAVRGEVAGSLLPHVRDNTWFFDAELLILAEKSGMRIHEVPVDWVDDPGTTVAIVSTACDDLRGILRLGDSLVRGKLPINELSAEHGRFRLLADQDGTPPGLAGQVLRFCLVGALSTVVFLPLFFLLRPRCGSQLANVLALLLTAVGNTAANRYFTFGIRARAGVARHHAQGLLVFVIALALNAVALRTGRAVFGHGDDAVDLIALLTASGFAALVRFLMLRRWVFRSELRTRPATARKPAEFLPRQRTAGDRADEKCPVGD